MKLYVVTAPPPLRGVYDTWPACEKAVAGARDAPYQSVGSRAEAEAILRGESVVLPVGVYAFIDGNEQGGVGVVFVKRRAGTAPVVKEISTSVMRVFKSSTIVGLDPASILDAQRRLRNILAELAALYYAIQHCAPGTALTLVHDYDGLAHWMQGRWQIRDPLVHDIIKACQRAVTARELRIAYHHQLGHQPIRFNEFARYNARADTLATEGGRR
jgi:ribonuclease H-related protein